MLYENLSNNRPFCENRLSDCHTFTVRRFILLSFKHQTNKPTAISVQHNQWQYKHKTSELQTTVTAGSVLTHVTATYIVKYKIKIELQYIFTLWLCGCILALVIERKKRMCHIILPSVACLAVPYYSTFIHKRQKVCVYLLYYLAWNTSSTFNDTFSLMYSGLQE